MAWELSGTYFENCSCDSACPCATSGFGQPSDQDYCHATLGFDIDGGQVEGLDVAERTVALVGDAPKMMADGGWVVGLFIDDGASDEQAEALGTVFGGQAGGPPGALAPLIGRCAVSSAHLFSTFRMSRCTLSRSVAPSTSK